MLVQIGGSEHAWLGDRGPWLTLIAAIDDATGKLAAAVFRKEEDASLLLPAGAAARTTAFRSITIDMASLPKRAKQARPRRWRNSWRANSPPPSSGDGTEELEITSIAARSPQAKGRAERLFGTDA